jgi:hypothetical protein
VRAGALRPEPEESDRGCSETLTLRRVPGWLVGGGVCAGQLLYRDMK